MMILSVYTHITLHYIHIWIWSQDSLLVSCFYLHFSVQWFFFQWYLHTFFYKEGFFSTQPQCCLTCSYWAQIELQILLNTYKATSFLFSGLRVCQHFFFQNRKKKFLQTFYFYFVLQRYDTFFFNFKTRSPRITSICFLYINC